MYTDKALMLIDFAKVVNLRPDGEVVLIGESAIEPDFDKPMTEWVQVGKEFYIIADIGGVVESTLGIQSTYFEMSND